MDKKYFDAAKHFGLSEEEAISFRKKLQREPTVAEVAVCGALWSEHCSYKSSRVHLKRFHTQESWVIQGPGENAGVVAINKNYGIAFKMESHNHPSYLEPYQGAATGVGGILRDIFCMGASPIANLNCLRFGEGTWNATLLRDTVRGIGDYGNSVGVPTVTGNTAFHFGYSQNILVNAFCAGLVHKNKIYKGVLSDSTQAFAENILIYFGAATGRDGVHGATMSSAEFVSGKGSLKPTVQVGDPFAEKVLLEATLSLIEKGLTVGLQDMGAAGLTSSTVEMAHRSQCGVEIDLDAVPKRAANMQAWEILLSESQERMVCAVEPQQVDAVCAELQKFNLEFAVIGKVTQTGLFVCQYNGTEVTSLPVTLLVEDTPRYNWPLESREDYLKAHAVIRNEAHFEGSSEQNAIRGAPLVLKFNGADVHKAIEQGTSLENVIEISPQLIENLFSHPSFASRSAIFHHYCSTVQGQSVAACGTFKTASAAVVRLPRFAQDEGAQGNTGVAVAGGCEERWVELDPHAGSVLSALKVARKIVASGGVPIALTDCLNFGSPRSPTVMRQFSDAVDGINLVAKELKIPVVSGNVSLNNQTQGKPIPPTPMLGMVGKVEDVVTVPAAQLHTRYFIEKKNSSVILLHLRHKNSIVRSSYSASSTAWLLGKENRSCPSFNLVEEKAMWHAVSQMIANAQPLLCFPVEGGGLLGALVECGLNSRAQLELSEHLWKTKAQDLFCEGNMGFVLGVTSEAEKQKILSFVVTDMACTDVGFLHSHNVCLQKELFPFESTEKKYQHGLQKFFDSMMSSN